MGTEVPTNRYLFSYESGLIFLRIGTYFSYESVLSFLRIGKFILTNRDSYKSGRYHQKQFCIDNQPKSAALVYKALILPEKLHIFGFSKVSFIVNKK